MKKRFFNGDFLQECGWFLIIVAAVCAALIFGFRALGQGQPKAVQAWQQVSAGVFHDEDGDPVVIDVPEENAALSGVDCR